MKIMIGQVQQLDEETAAFARQLGIDAVQLNTPALDDSLGYWQYESLVELREHCNSLELDVVALENVPQAFM
jgi:mannonate dehydratase